jgi:hypothetical protein
MMQNEYDDYDDVASSPSPVQTMNDDDDDETQMTECMPVHRYTALQPPLFG